MEEESSASTYLRSPYELKAVRIPAPVRKGRNTDFSYLEYDQRAVPQIVPQLLVPLLHVPIRVWGSPKLRRSTYPAFPAQKSVRRYRKAESPIGDIV